MAVWSQPALCRSVEFSCYDLGHTWTPHCSLACTTVGIHCFKYSLKLYATVYLLTAALRAKKLTIKDARKMFLEILQSTCFLTWNGFGFILSICIFRWLLGRFYMINTGFLPGFLGSLTAIFLERKARRRMLTVYVLNIVSEALYRMLVGRKLVTPIPNGEVVLFSCAMAGFLFLYRKRDELKDVTSSALSFLIGPSEGGKQPLPKEKPSVGQGDSTASETVSTSLHPPKQRGSSSGLQKHIQSLHWLLRQGPRHSTCSHRNNCLYYWLQGFCKPFLVGYGARVVLGLVASLRTIIRKPQTLVHPFFNSRSIRMGLFLGSFCSIFKAINCLLRWLTNRDDPRYGLIGGFLAGWSMLIYREPSLATYTTWKLIEVLYLRGAKAGYLPIFAGGVELLYALATGFMFHVAVLEPQNLRPSYWKFLEDLTNKKMGEINRPLLDVFGTQSSKIFSKTKVISLDPHYTSQAFKDALGLVASV